MIEKNSQQIRKLSWSFFSMIHRMCILFQCVVCVISACVHLHGHTNVQWTHASVLIHLDARCWGQVSFLVAGSLAETRVPWCGSSGWTAGHRDALCLPPKGCAYCVTTPGKLFCRIWDLNSSPHACVESTFLPHCPSPDIYSFSKYSLYSLTLILRMRRWTPTISLPLGISVLFKFLL